MTDLMAEVREALRWPLTHKQTVDLLARLDGMTIVPAGEVERLEAFVESIGLSCCPHTQPASLREHVENEGWCVICREYVAHTDDTFRPVPWPCPTARLTGEVERLREALAMTGTEAVNLRVRVIEERAIAAERERIGAAVEGLAKWDKRSVPGGFHVNRAAVLAIVRGEEAGRG